MSSAPDSQTTTETAQPEAPDDPHRRPHLFLVLEGHRPLAPPARIALAAVDEIVFGRGPERRIEPVRDRRLAVRIDDRRMSSSHARLTKVLRRWVLEDAGSKNGTLVNGAPQASAELADGDLIEIGQTFLLFRDALPCEPGDPPILDASTMGPRAPGLATLLPSLGRTFARFGAIAPSAVSVILEGETGTGKEVLARALHGLSGRTGEFVAVNCGALPRDLVEGELFGHRRGAFSGATEDRPGLVRSADKGTLFLDEIGDLPASSQAALLRVLQEHEVRPLGATRSIPVDLRVVAATHRSLDQMASRGDFREDLLARLAGHRLELPPLRSRLEDLGLLLGALLGRLPREQAAKVALHPRAARALLLHAWPGNVRELEKCLRSAVVLAGEGLIELEHLPEAVQHALGGAAAARERDEAARRDGLVALLREHGGNVSAVAKQMGKARMQVQRWLKRYAIDPERFRR
jgi:transcriptional regulator of acetoin/glycerol metabolism